MPKKENVLQLHTEKVKNVQFSILPYHPISSLSLPLLKKITQRIHLHIAYKTFEFVEDSFQS
jgi:hypothetical protein